MNALWVLLRVLSSTRIECAKTNWQTTAFQKHTTHWRARARDCFAFIFCGWSFFCLSVCLAFLLIPKKRASALASELTEHIGWIFFFVFVVRNGYRSDNSNSRFERVFQFCEPWYMRVIRVQSSIEMQYCSQHSFRIKRDKLLLLLSSCTHFQLGFSLL